MSQLRIANTESIVAVLSGAKTTNDCDYICSFADQSSTAFNMMAPSYARTNGATEVELVAAPAAGTVRSINYISIYNADTVSSTVLVKVKKAADSSLYLICRVTLATLETLEFNGANWTIRTASGDVRGPASSTDNAIVRFDATTGKYVQNSGVTIDDSNIVLVPSLTASKLVLTDGSKNLVSAAYTNTDYALLASPTFTGTPAAPTAANGTSTTQLATTAFVQNEVQFYFGNGSLNIAAPTGQFSVTGVPFTPRKVTLFGSIHFTSAMSIGIFSASNKFCMYDTATITVDTYDVTNTQLAAFLVSSGNYAVWTLYSMNSDGFTITHTKTGSPTGTIDYFYMAER